MRSCLDCSIFRFSCSYYGSEAGASHGKPTCITSGHCIHELYRDMILYRTNIDDILITERTKYSIDILFTALNSTAQNIHLKWETAEQQMVVDSCHF